MLFLIYFTVLFFPVIFYLTFVLKTYFNNKKNSLYAMSLLNRVPLGASVVYMLTRQRINVSKACQFVFTCQRPNKYGNLPICQSRINFQLGVQTCQKGCQFFNFVCQKVYQFSNYFSKQFFNFGIF